MAITFSSYFQTIPGILNKLPLRVCEWPLVNGAGEGHHSGTGCLTLACARVSAGTVSTLLIMVTPMSTLCWAPSWAFVYTSWINKWEKKAMVLWSVWGCPFHLKLLLLTIVFWLRVVPPFWWKQELSSDWEPVPVPSLCLTLHCLPWQDASVSY